MELRVLILAPRGRDAQIASDLLRRHGFDCFTCGGLASLVDELKMGAGTALITEEALASSDRAGLMQWIADQPTWSDLPFVVLANGDKAPRSAQATMRLDDLGNIILLERPLHADAMVGAIRSAIKARRRQYEIRAFAATLEKSVDDRTAQLEAARETLEVALDAAGMGNWDMDLATGRIDRTIRHDQIFGYDELQQEFDLKRLISHVVLSERATVAAAFEVAPTKSGLGIEFQITAANGDLRWIALQGRARHDAQGKATRLTGVVSDITARKEADAKLAQAQKMDAIGQLTGGVAHDFNNLLTPIVGSLDILRRRIGDDARDQKLVAGALQAAERASTLTQRLLAFARRQTLQPSAVDIGALIDGISDLMRRSLGPTINIVFDVPDGLAPARVDPNQLELALLNLAINARDAMPNGGRLTLSAATVGVADQDVPGLRAGRYVRVVASDTGTGMDEATLARAIEPFFSTKGVGKGTGLGLSMVHGLAAQSGGTLQLSSVLGEGTTISLWLPASEESAGSLVTSGHEPIKAARDAQILLVDDEDLVRSATADMLRDIGYTVHEVSSAAQAITLLRDGLEAEALVTDYLMPEKTGAQLIQEIRSEGLDLPTLLITGYANAAEDIPADVTKLPKPFRQVELAARISDLLSRQGDGISQVGSS